MSIQLGNSVGSLALDRDLSVYNGSFFERTTGASGFVQNGNGTWETVPKTPAYVIGEQVLRPMIDRTVNVCQWGWSYVKGTLTAVDRCISRCVTLFPVAEGAVVESSSNNMEVGVRAVHNQFVSVRAIQIISDIGIDPKGVRKFITTLSPPEKNAILENKELQESFQRWNAIFLDLAGYIAQKGLAFQEYKNAIVLSCNNLYYLESHVLEMKADLEKRGADSQYHPFSGNKYVLHLDDAKRLKNYGQSSFYQILTYWFKPAVQRAISPIVDQNRMRHIEFKCYTNPVEAALVEHLLTLAQLTNAFNVNDQFTLEDFQRMFSNRTIEIFKEQVEQMKANLDKGLTNIQDIVDQYNHKLHQSILKDLYESIYQLRNEHARIVGNTRGRYFIKPINYANNLVIGWEVWSSGYIYDSQVFKFRVGPLINGEKDEL